MFNIKSALKDRLAAELKIKNKALRNLQLKDLLDIPLRYSKVCKGTVDDILHSYVDKFLEGLEKESVVVEIRKSPGKSSEIIDLFRAHEFDVDDEKLKTVSRFSAVVYKNCLNKITGAIEWDKLVGFNSTNPDQDRPIPNS